MNQQQQPQAFKNKGQSLVEVALFLPIFVLIIAGLVEVSQLVITQNRVSTASRAAARFGANGGEDDGMVTVALNSVTQTLDLDESVWDIWAIRVEFDGTGVIDDSKWQFNHVYGQGLTSGYASVDENAIKAEVQQQLQTDQFGNTDQANAQNLKAVGVLIIHDVESILGLDAFPALQGFNSVRALNIMRISGLEIEQTNGCSAFPIAVEDGIRNVTQATFPTNFDYPTGSNIPTLDDYPNTPKDASSYDLRNAKEGVLFFIRQGSGSGNFGWLRWNQAINPSAGTLSDSLTWPGDSTDYSDHGDGGNFNLIAGWGGNYIPRGYVEPGDPTDQSLNVGDWVAASTGAVASVGSTNCNGANGCPMKELVDKNSAIRVIVWSADDPAQTGVNDRYLISGFVVMRIVGYHLSNGGGSWVLAEFVRWDESCGQVIQ
ncbi:MAG: hypothetical protein Kow0080_10950 [Candidatus Promineifilaceae bacterium]